jgi:hypothetical protein
MIVAIVDERDLQASLAAPITRIDQVHDEQRHQPAYFAISIPPWAPAKPRRAARCEILLQARLSSGEPDGRRNDVQLVSETPRV